MKRSVLVFAILFGWAVAACAAPPGTLTSLRAIHALTNAEAHQALPVAFEGTVTYYSKPDQMLFVQDAGVAVYVQAPLNAKLAPGDRVLVRGITRDSYRPEVVGDSITIFLHGKLPRPLPATFSQLIRGQRDCLLVTVRGQIRTADQLFSSSIPIRSMLLTGGGVIQLDLDSGNARALEDLLDAQVEVTGVAAGSFDGMMQMTGVELNVSSLADIRILKHAAASPWSLPATPMDAILNSYNEKSLTKRILVHGVITYNRPGFMVVLQSGVKTLRIMTRSYTPLRVGDQADATGFPDLVNGFLTLTSAEVHDRHLQESIPPRPATWEQLSSASNIFNLVSIEGQVVMEARESAQDEYVLVSDGHMFSAIYHHPDASSMLPIPAMKQVPPGSKVRITGICEPFSSDPFSGPVPFDILLRSPGDVAVIASPSWLSIRNLILIAGLLLVFLLVLLAKGWALERRVHRQSVTMAAHSKAKVVMERQRSRILEEINGSEPLAGILKQIAEFVSLRLDGVPCWCEVTDGARLGKLPPDEMHLRVVRQEIVARSGPALGTLNAAFPPGRTPASTEQEELLEGTRLATLAIETRRMNADLQHRSEFDLLTDIRNRFSLEKRLDGQIEEARQIAGIFGLIYIDLDGFKLVNDRYGHRTGDLFLQEVALRMKRQLRSHDLLARLGGDEFAVLLPMARSRADVEEIAQRLDRCFDDQLVLEGYVLHGSASFGIALYPEDGLTRDCLLSAADSAMYAAKNARIQAEIVTGKLDDPAGATRNRA